MLFKVGDYVRSVKPGSVTTDWIGVIKAVDDLAVVSKVWYLVEFTATPQDFGWLEHMWMTENEVAEHPQKGSW